MQSLSGSSFWTFPVIMSAAAVTESESQQISSHKPRSPASPEEALSGGVTSTRGRGARCSLSRRWSFILEDQSPSHVCDRRSLKTCFSSSSCICDDPKLLKQFIPHVVAPPLLDVSMETV